jgi:hypothetical protein
MAIDAVYGQTAATATEVDRMTFMENVTVTDFNITFAGGGGTASVGALIGKSLGGTGAFSVIGTATVGTPSDNSGVEGTVTATNFVTGDDVVIQIAAGTAAGSTSEEAFVQYKEHFVAD